MILYTFTSSIKREKKKEEKKKRRKEKRINYRIINPRSLRSLKEREMSGNNEKVCSSGVISRKVELSKFSPDDISSIIGPSSKSCEENPKMKKFPSLKKNVVTPSWKSFKTYQESLEETHPNKEKNPGKIFVKLSRGMNKEKKDVVLATIECESEEMFKFIMLHLNKYQESFKRPQRKMFYNIYATFPNHLIPLLIGSGGSGVRELKKYATEFMDESFTGEDVDKCEKSFLKVNSFEPKDREDFFSNFNSERNSFIGDHPTEEEKMIKISVSSFATKESFTNFSECLCDVVQEKLEDIKVRDEEREKKRNQMREEDLAECMEALEQEW